MKNQFDSILRLAMHRTGCTSKVGHTTRQLWLATYRQFRQEARDLRHVQKQLIQFRGF